MREGVCNPVTHVLFGFKVVKRFDRGYKPRPALGSVFLSTELHFSKGSEILQKTAL
jgi:hypothetical protein